MLIETYKGFEIFQDEEMFDLFSYRDKTIGNYCFNGAWNKNPSFRSVEDVKKYLDGWIDGKEASVSPIVVNVWNRTDYEDYSSKILHKDNTED